ERPAVGVDNEEDGSAALAGGIAAHRRAVDEQVVAVAVGVDRAAAAASRGAAGGGVRARPDRLVAGHHAVVDGEVRVEPAEGGAVGAGVAGERVLGDVHRDLHVHAGGADRPAAQVRAAGVALIAGEHGVDHLELAALVEDGPAPVAGRLRLHGR